MLFEKGFKLLPKLKVSRIRQMINTQVLIFIFKKK